MAFDGVVEHLQGLCSFGLRDLMAGSFESGKDDSRVDLNESAVLFSNVVNVCKPWSTNISTDLLKIRWDKIKELDSLNGIVVWHDIIPVSAVQVNLVINVEQPA